MILIKIKILALIIDKYLLFKKMGSAESSTCCHDRLQNKCKTCKYKCSHGKNRAECKDCGGSSLCQHGRRKSRCKECGGHARCEHGIRLCFSR